MLHRERPGYVDYFSTPPDYDCPSLSAYFDHQTMATIPPLTIRWTAIVIAPLARPLPRTGIGDADGDGVPDDVDCDDNDPNVTTSPGALR